jgi:hypothetical protein
MMVNETPVTPGLSVIKSALFPHNFRVLIEAAARTDKSGFNLIYSYTCHCQCRGGIGLYGMNNHRVAEAAR